MSARDQQLADKLQAALPLAQLAAENAKRQAADLAAIVERAGDDGVAAQAGAATRRRPAGCEFARGDHSG